MILFKRILMLSIICLGLQLISRAQQVEKGFELLQILKLSEAYKNAPNLSFSVDYTYADSTNPSTILEEVTGSSKASSGKYWSMLDSVEFIQGSQYNLAVYHADSTIVVTDRKEYGDFLKINFLDSLFRQANVDSMSVTAISDTVWQLQVLFHPNSGFSQYTIEYNPKKYLVNKIMYYVKGVADDSGGITSGTALITLTVSNYSFGAVDQSIFNESRFIYKQNGQFQTKPQYSNYTLINNSVN